MKKLLLLIFCLHSTILFSKGLISLHRYHRINDPVNDSVEDNSLIFEFDSQLLLKKLPPTYMNGSVKYDTGNKKFLYSLSEAFIQQKRGITEVQFGKKILDWNRNEKYWSLGELNQLRGFNLLEDHEEGLLGLHLDRRGRYFRVSLFGSYLFLPQLNPGVEIVDGKISSSSEWAKLPPDSIDFNDELIPIYYTLDMPKISSVILQESYGALLGAHWTGGSLNVYGLYKPENLLRINATGYYEQDTEERAKVITRPFVNHHWVYGFGLSQKLYNITFDGGIMHIAPNHGEDNDFEFESLKIVPTYNNETYAHANVGIDFNNYKLSFNAIGLLSKVPSVLEPFTKVSKWRQAFGVKGELSLFDRLSAKANYKFDTILKDSIFTASANYLFLNRALLEVGIEFLESPTSVSYWSAFRSNDSFYTKLSYKF